MYFNVEFFHLERASLNVTELMMSFGLNSDVETEIYLIMSNPILSPGLGIVPYDRLR